MVNKRTKRRLEAEERRTAKRDRQIMNESRISKRSPTQAPSWSQRFRSILRSRYTLMVVILLVVFGIMLASTASIQLTAARSETDSQSSGEIRQRVELAARGDIYDRNGVPLAITTNRTMLYLADANLDDEALNASLLDLALLLEDYGLDYGHAIDSYLDLESMTFTQPTEDIIYWQKNRNFLALKDLPEGQAEDYSDTRYIKYTPLTFYRFLRFTKFDIAPSYTDIEAKKILRLRFELYLNNWSFQQGTPVLIAEDIPDDLITILNEQSYRYQGVVLTEEPQREYTDDAVYLAPVLGYVGPITGEEYRELSDQGYLQTDYVGKAGIEQVAERYLHGTNGLVPYNVWSSDMDEGTFVSEQSGTAAISGDSIRLTIDIDLQKIGMQTMAAMVDYYKHDDRDVGYPDPTGSAVMLDLKNNNAVLAMINYPTYDPQDFIDQSTDAAAAVRVQNYLSDTEELPMLNRAIYEANAPGSTMKVFTALAMLDANVTTPAEQVNCPGYMIIDGMRFNCAGVHGHVDLNHAIPYSCNIYFYTMGLRVGIDRLEEVYKSLGLGEPTGIELYGESVGVRPGREQKAAMFADPGNQVWFPADTAQAAIGQGLNAYTMLQLARAVGAVATGELGTPHVISEILAADGSVTQPTIPDPVQLPYDESDLAAVREAMYHSTVDDYAVPSQYFEDTPYLSAGKTGTSDRLLAGFGQTTDGRYIAFAPYDDPEVAVAAGINISAQGGFIATVARVLFDAYFDVGDPESIIFKVEP